MCIHGFLNTEDAFVCKHYSAEPLKPYIIFFYPLKFLSRYHELQLQMG